jgi:hypothetical protein
MDENKEASNDAPAQPANAEPATPPTTTPTPAQPPQQTSGKGYGKRPMWQWVVLYLIVGGLLYWLVYALVFADGGETGGGLY